MKHVAKKSLGQNFLKSNSTLEKIVASGNILEGDTVLEIGPGKGALTEKILRSGSKLIAVEKDDNLYDFLKDQFSEQIKSGQLKLVHDDILDFDLIKSFPEIKNYKVIANIPYNITGAILKKFLTAQVQPTSMVLLVQKEVAERIVARDGKESILSISVKAYGVPKMLGKVPARYFKPAPKVDSAIIAINEISKKSFNHNTKPAQSLALRKEEGVGRGVGGAYNNGDEEIKKASETEEERFWEVVKAGFAHKRKKLSNNLRGIVDFQKTELGDFKNKRAEDLSLKDWISIAKI